MTAYDSATEAIRTSLLTSLFKKTAYTGPDLYLGFYQDSTPANEISFISRVLVPAADWTVVNVDDNTTKVYNNKSITIGPINSSCYISGYNLYSASTAGTLVMPLALASDFHVGVGAYIKIDIASITVNMDVA